MQAPAPEEHRLMCLKFMSTISRLKKRACMITVRPPFARLVGREHQDFRDAIGWTRCQATYGGGKNRLRADIGYCIGPTTILCL
jgi:hypothetical protein